MNYLNHRQSVETTPDAKDVICRAFTEILEAVVYRSRDQKTRISICIRRSWVMYVLMPNETVLDACQKDVDRVLPNGTEITYERINNLVICKAILKEILRLYPPMPYFVQKYR